MRSHADTSKTAGPLAIKASTIHLLRFEEIFMLARFTGPVVLTLGWLTGLVGCAPTVKVEAPDKPIEINMNVKIEHEIRLKVEKDVDELLSENKGLF